MSPQATFWRVSLCESAKTRDITGGLPRVAGVCSRLVAPKDHAIIAEITGTVM